MGLLFSDNFNRANATSLGGAWAYLAGNNVGVQTNRAYAVTNNATVAVNPTGITSDDHVAVCQALVNGYTNRHTGLVVRCSQNMQDGYYCVLHGNTNGWLEVGYFSGGVFYELARNYQVASTIAPRTLALSITGSLLRCVVDGVCYIELTDTNVVNGQFAGFRSESSGFYADDFTVYDSLGSVLSIAPGSVDVDSVDTLLTLTSVGAGWTPGTPGSPTFTSDIGTITSQEVLTSESATVTYQAPSYQVTDTLRDPQNGSSVHLAVGLPAAYDVTEVLRRLGLWDVGDSVADAFTSVKDWALPDNLWEPSDSLKSIAADIGISVDGIDFTSNVFLAFADGEPQDKSLYNLLLLILSQVLQGDPNSALALVQLTDMVGTPAKSLADVINTLRGGVDVTLSDLYNQLSNIITVDGLSLGSVVNLLNNMTGNGYHTLENIRDDISAVRGLNAPDIAGVLSNLDAFRTLSQYTVQDILDAIGDIGTFDDSDIITAINAVRGTNSPDIAQVLTAIGNLDIPGDVDLSGVLTAIAGVRGAGSPDIAQLLTAVQALPQREYHAPVWPGVANVTYGTPRNIAASVSITEPMHGCRIALTSVPVGRTTIGYGNLNAWLKVAYMCFVSDVGDAEYPQVVSYSQGVYLPRTMTAAGGLRLNALPAVVGTITPFTIT